VRRVKQSLRDILDSLQPLKVDWRDDVATRVIDRLQAFPVKKLYSGKDLRDIIEGGPFEDGMLMIRLFLGMSKDTFTAAMLDALGAGGSGSKRYAADPEFFITRLVDMGVLDAMSGEVSRKAHWSDVLVERLRSGRGSAISGQKRGRGAEDFAEVIVKRVFGAKYAARVTFAGKDGKGAKCDFAIPSRDDPEIVIESKGYGATGSKMTDVIGDIEKIIAAKRSDTDLLFFTDGLTWKQRQADLAKIVSYQNGGDIARIYTYAMAVDFEADLKTLKKEKGI
jgi:hypothetical protein